MMEEAFRKEKETLSMILERTPHGISLVDNDGKYLYLNPYYTKITGYTLEDIPSREEWFKKHIQMKIIVKKSSKPGMKISLRASWQKFENSKSNARMGIPNISNLGLLS